MIDFEKELKHYKEKALISEVEDNIKENKLYCVIFMILIMISSYIVK